MRHRSRPGLDRTSQLSQLVELWPVFHGAVEVCSDFLRSLLVEVEQVMDLDFIAGLLIGVVQGTRPVIFV